MNEQAAKAFAAAFDPPLQVVHSENLNGQRVKDCYCASGMVADDTVGITCVIFGNGHMKAYVEVVGARDMAAEVGEKFAKLTEIWNARDQ